MEIILRINGIPREQPKLVNVGPGTPRPRDPKIRARDPQTGRLIKKMGGGYLYEMHPRQNWKDKIARTAIAYMIRRGLEPIAAGMPIIIGTVFFLPRPEKLPSGRQYPMSSDLDNLKYPIWNTLKAIKRRSGSARRAYISPAGICTPNRIETAPEIWPDGICFADDSQIVMELPSAKLYAGDLIIPGVMVFITDKISERIVSSILKMYPIDALERALPKLD